MKKLSYFLIGAVSLVVFGLLLPQPIQALLVIIDSPIKEFFVIHTLGLCVIVGLIQGISEECGYYFVLKQILKKEKSDSLPFWFGLGRSSIHTLFDMITIIVAFSNMWVFVFAIVSRMFSFAVLMKLTMLDYFSYQKKNVLYLGLSVLLHAILNSILYAHELQLFDIIANFDIWFMIIYSIAVIVISGIICRKE